MESDGRLSIYKALAQKTGFEVVNENLNPGQLRIVGRLPKGKMNFFTVVVQRLMKASSDAMWSVDISRPYMLAANGQLRYAWRFIFQAPNVETYFPEIANVVMSSPSPARVELEEAPLPGYTPGVERGGQNARGKGAATMFKAVTGVQAKQRLNSGGH